MSDSSDTPKSDPTLEEVVSGDAAGERKREHVHIDGGFVRALKASMHRAFTENKRFKFVALVLAVTLFILVNSDKEAVIGVYVGVSYTLPEDKVLTSEPVDRVRVTVKGTWRRVKRFDERELDRILVDLTNMSTGEYTFQEDMIKLPHGLELLSINPPSIRVEFDQRAEKSVPVTPSTAGQPPEGYRVERIRLDPSHVTVRGAEKIVSAISTVRTRDILLTGRTESFTENVSLSQPEQYVAVSENVIRVDVDIAEQLVARELGPVKIQLRPFGELGVPLDERFSVDPPEVTLIARGNLLAVEKLAENLVPIIEVRPSDAMPGKSRKATVEIEGVPEGVGIEVVPRKVTLTTEPPAPPRPPPE